MKNPVLEKGTSFLYTTVHRQRTGYLWRSWQGALHTRWGAAWWRVGWVGWGVSRESAAPTGSRRVKREVGGWGQFQAVTLDFMWMHPILPSIDKCAHQTTVLQPGRNILYLEKIYFPPRYVFYIPWCVHRWLNIGSTLSRVKRGGFSGVQGGKI